MKKLFLLAIAIMVTSVTFAQGISIGAKAGVNYGATKTSDADYNNHFNPIIAPHFGVVADIALTDDFSVQPELLFSPSGFNRNEEGIETPVEGVGTIEVDYNDIKGRLSYLTIPIMAKYYFVDGLSLEAGPYIGFLISTKRSGNYVMHLPEIAGGDITTEFGDDDQDDFKETYNSIDYGLGVGASYALEMGVFFTARYNMGLSDINAEDLSAIPVTDGVLDKDDSIKNNIIQFSVGYKFM